MVICFPSISKHHMGTDVSTGDAATLTTFKVPTFFRKVPEF